MASCVFDVLTIPGSSAPVERVFQPQGMLLWGNETG